MSEESRNYYYEVKVVLDAVALGKILTWWNQNIEGGVPRIETILAFSTEHTLNWVLERGLRDTGKSDREYAQVVYDTFGKGELR